MSRNQNDENPQIISTNVIKISDGDFVANGSANVTISNVAPAAVGTATISKWLEFESDNGTRYYIPCWT